MIHQFTHSFFHFSCHQLTLKTKKTWQTSHSSTSQRHNFLVQISSKGKKGRGEAGLPPKKEGCYLADPEDCFGFFEVFRERLEKDEIKVNEEILNIGEYFNVFRGDKERERFLTVLSVLHSFEEPTYRAAISAIEFALFDLWASSLNLPLLQCIYNTVPDMQFKSFIAVSQGTTQIQDAKEATERLPFIKLKFKNDFETISTRLQHLIENNIGEIISLDANASWSPDTTRQVIDFIAEKKYQEKIYCLEQPFEVYPKEEWKEVFEYAKSKNVRIMADESFANGDDVEKVKEFSNAANIKIEKAGGLINSIKGLIKAKEAGMEIWLGLMISSWLGATQTFMLAPLANYGDLDAGTIVWSPYTAGFKSNTKGYIELVKGNGLAVEQITESENYI